jgi:mono/diheme cytochrome c family protein
MYGRWPFRQGTALGIGVMMLLAIGVIAMLQSAASGQLPVGYPFEGEYAFADHCGGCHGAYAYGTEQAPSLITSEFAADELDRDGFADTIRDGVGTMPGFDDLEKQEVADIIAFVREIRLEAGL